MTTTLNPARLALAAAGFLTFGSSVLGQSQTLSITLTGQSMIASDIRAHAPTAVPVIESPLKGDVVFTNFETTIVIGNSCG
jgi:hypothetical protein